MVSNGKYDNTYEGVENMCATLFGWRGETTADSEFLCYCPVHGDSKPSLHVGLDENNGAILMRCMSHECDVYKYVSDRRGWPQQAKSAEEAKIKNSAYVKRNPNIGGTRFKWTSVPASLSEAKAYLSTRNETYSYTEESSGKRVTMAKTMAHIYTDGEMAHSIVIRYDDVSGILPKQIRQHSFGYYDAHPELPAGAPTSPNNPKFQTKAWRNDNIPHMPYAVTYIRSKPKATVVIVEGEKAADYGNIHLSISHPDYVFTTWKGGSSAVRFTSWEEIAGRNVIIIPDNDGTGRNAAKELHDYLAAEGLPNDIWIADITQFDLPKKWDIADLKNANRHVSWPVFPQIVARDIAVHDFDHLNIISGTQYSDEYSEEHAGNLGGDPYEGRYGGDNDAGGDSRTQRELIEGRTREPVFFARSTRFDYKPDGGHYRELREFFSGYGTINTGNEVRIFSKTDALRGSGEGAVFSIKKFHQLFSHVKIQPSEKATKYVPATHMWLESDHAVYEDYVSTPLKPVTFVQNNLHFANVWPGIEASRATEIGDDTAFYEHLRFICSGENEETSEKLFYFLMCVLANMVQRPGIRPGKIIFFSGAQGCGKSTVHEFLVKMFGDKTSLIVDKPSRILGQFNEVIGGKLLIAVDEAKLNGKGSSSSDFDAIKHLVTTSKTTSEKKFGTQSGIDLFFTLFCCTNHTNFADIADGERRICPIAVPDTYTRLGEKRLESGAYFKRIYDSMHNGGPAAFYKRLMAFQLPESLPDFPDTKFMRVQKMQSMENNRESVFYDWLSQCLRNRQIIGSDGGTLVKWEPGKRVQRSVFHDQFERWHTSPTNMKKYGLRKGEFFKELNNLCYGRIKNNDDAISETVLKGGFRCIVSAGTTMMEFPQIRDAQQLFDSRVMYNPNYDSGGYTDSECQDDLEITKH